MAVSDMPVSASVIRLDMTIADQTVKTSDTVVIVYTFDESKRIYNQEETASASVIAAFTHDHVKTLVMCHVSCGAWCLQTWVINGI